MKFLYIILSSQNFNISHQSTPFDIFVANSIVPSLFVFTMVKKKKEGKRKGQVERNQGYSEETKTKMLLDGHVLRISIGEVLPI